MEGNIMSFKIVGNIKSIFIKCGYNSDETISLNTICPSLVIDINIKEQNIAIKEVFIGDVIDYISGCEDKISLINQLIKMESERQEVLQ